MLNDLVEKYLPCEQEIRQLREEANSELSISVRENVGYIQLERPAAIHALSLPMVVAINATLNEWAADDTIAEVVISSTGQRGFCAGGDVKTMYQHIADGNPEKALEFLAAEYLMDNTVATFNKPITAKLFGISMGGGLGLTLPPTHRVATEDLIFAMPETKIGFWPDVGMAYQLSRCPGQVGVWLALTGESVGANDALAFGLINEITPAEDSTEPKPTQFSDYATALALANESGETHWIDECFVGYDPLAILDRLSQHPAEQANQCAEIIKQRSPLSVTIALCQIRLAEKMDSPSEALVQDWLLAENYLTKSDFAEGVCAQLVRKDRNPKWRFTSLTEVDFSEISDLFNKITG